MSICNLLLPEQPMSNVLTLKEVTGLNSFFFHLYPGSPQTLTPRFFPDFVFLISSNQSFVQNSSSLLAVSTPPRKPSSTVDHFLFYLFEKSNTF